jgi:hypothetical protein
VEKGDGISGQTSLGKLIDDKFISGSITANSNATAYRENFQITNAFGDEKSYLVESYLPGCWSIGKRNNNASNSDMQSDVRLAVFPNPAYDNIKLLFNFPELEGSKSIQILDFSGKKVSAFDVFDKSGLISFDVSLLPSGMYSVITLLDKSHILNIKKFVITR